MAGIVTTRTPSPLPLALLSPSRPLPLLSLSFFSFFVPCVNMSASSSSSSSSSFVAVPGQDASRSMVAVFGFDLLFRPLTADDLDARPNDDGPLYAVRPVMWRADGRASHGLLRLRSLARRSRGAL